MGFDAEAVAKHWAFVVGAYLTVFGAWAAAAVYDFITPTWRTVGDVRRHGLYHLAALVVPVTYMCVYMTTQALAKDYQEMSPGLLALLFACVDFLRTAMGLWQLHTFKQWVMRSVRSIESLGYKAELNENHDGSTRRQNEMLDLGRGIDRLNKIADAVRINDTIVENRLNEGAVRCFVHLRNPPSEKTGAGTLVSVLRWVEALFQLPRVLFRAVRSKSDLRSKQDSKIVLEPRRPEDIWLRWACVLVSQVFPKLPEDMKKSGFLRTSTGSDLETNAFEFAKGILISAALHTQGASTGTNSESTAREDNGTKIVPSKPLPHEFLQGEMWKEYPDLCRGIFSHQEFLKQACTTGCGLPFGAPHPKAITKSEGKTQYTYSKYEKKLERAREMLTVEDFESLGDFNTEELEWLAIMLSVATWNPALREPEKDIKTTVGCERELSGMDAGDGPGTNDNNTEVHCEKSSDDVTMTKERNSTVTSIAFDNLVTQLGLHGKSKCRGFDVELKYINRFPLLQGALEHMFLDNRNVLEASSHIDNFLALCAGDQYAFMMEKERETTQTIVGARRSVGLENVFEVKISQDEELENDTAKNEQERLLYQFVKERPEFWYLDQRMTFLGCSMESLRSSLAKWAKGTSGAQSSSWVPNIACYGEDRFGKFSFSASDSFRRCVGTFPFTAQLKSRYTQMRLLFELQHHLHGLASKKSLSPSCAEAMTLCILSFPSLHVKVDDRPNSEEVAEVSNDGCSIRFLTESVVLFAVPKSPQPIHVPVRLQAQKSDSLTISFSIAVEGENVTNFEWEAWRNNYLDRLESVRKWQGDHNLPFASLTKTAGRICRGVGEARVSGTGTGEAMNVWLGWLPPRPTLSLFELKTSGFIARQENRTYQIPSVFSSTVVIHTGIQKKRQVSVGYDDAMAADLEHASSVGRGVLDVIAGIRCEDSTSFSVQGKRLLREDDENGGNRTTLLFNWQLRLMEAVSVHTGQLSSVRTAVEHILKQRDDFSSAKRVVGMIETFCATVATRRQVNGFGYPVFHFDENSMESDVVKLFKALLARTQHASVVAESMARIFSSFANYQGDQYADSALIALRQATLCSPWEKSQVHVRNLKPVLGGIMCRKSGSKHTLPMLLVCGEDLERLSLAKSPVLGNTQLYEKNNVFWPALSLDMYCCGMFAASSSFRNDCGAGRKECGELCSNTQSSSNDTRHVQMLCKSAALLLILPVKGVYRSFPIARALLEHAVKHGQNLQVAGELEHMLTVGGEGVRNDAPHAVQLSSRAIDEGGHVDAMVRLGNLLVNGGEGVEKDAPRAVELYSRAIDEGGDVYAMFNLGLLLEDGGEGVEKDAPRAVELYSRAIDEGGDVDAMVRLGNLLVNGGEGVEKNARRAAELYSRARRE